MLPETFLQLANSLIQLVLEIQKGQPVEVKKQLWEWYVQDISWWRKFLKIDEDKKK